MVKLRQSHSVNLVHFQFENWLSQMNFAPETTQKIVMAYNYAEGKFDEDAMTFILRGVQMIEVLKPLAMDDDSLIAAFLFPIYNANLLDIDKILDKFGKNISTLVKGVKLLEQINNFSLAEEQIENTRRMLLSMVEDVRCVVLKLAERILFLRDKNNTEQIRVLAAKECEKIYSPLANHLGIGQLKWEMEDYVFRILHPDDYFFLAKVKIRETRLEREQYLNDFIETLKLSLSQEISDFEIYGRVKHIFSVYKKMQKKNCEFEDLFDIRAVRILTKNIEDCYLALDVVHKNFTYIKEEFDDYISKPKPNGYQSIHTVVKGKEDKVIEVQIRTEQMHQDAELGVAAHWKYKEGGKTHKNNYQDKINCLRKLLDWQSELSDELSGEKSDIFNDRIYVFTPRGEIIDLPPKSTPLDFAYSIHSEVGHKCVCAKVAGKIVPFTYQLQTGDQIEIITQKNTTPSRDWLNTAGFLNTSRARAKVAAYFKKQDRDKNIPLGKNIFETELAKTELALKQIEKAALKRYNLKLLDDLYAAIGAGDIKISQLMSFLQNKFIKQSSEIADDLVLKNIIKKEPKEKHKDAIIIEGVGNLMYSIARCCEPIIGDKIAGYITLGRGVSIHKQDCDQFFELKSANPTRIISASWGNNAQRSQLNIKITANDRSGLLRDITNVLANEKVNMLAIDSKVDYKTQMAHLKIEIEIKDSDQLPKLLGRLSSINSVVSATRYAQ